MSSRRCCRWTSCCRRLSQLPSSPSRSASVPATSSTPAPANDCRPTSGCRAAVDDAPLVYAGVGGTGIRADHDPDVLRHLPRAAFDASPRDDYAPLMLALTRADSGDARAPDRPCSALHPSAAACCSSSGDSPSTRFACRLRVHRFDRDARRPALRRSRRCRWCPSSRFPASDADDLLIEARRRLGRSSGASLIATAFLGLELFQGSFSPSRTVLDPLAVADDVGVLLSSRPSSSCFVPLIVASAAMNEKVAIIALVFGFSFLAWIVRRRPSPFRSRGDSWAPARRCSSTLPCG